MPRYEYLDSKTGKTVELQKPIAERDNVPAHLKRQIASVSRNCAGFRDSECRESGVDERVPIAFREMELQGQSWRKICKDAGYPGRKGLEHIKRTWGMLAVLTCLIAFSTGAADLTSGHTFIDGEHVSASTLNSVISGASINSSFITDKSAADPENSDQFIYSKSGTLKRVTLSSLTGVSNIISARNEISTTLTNDYLLILEGSTLSKVQLGTLLSKISGNVTSITTTSPNTNNYIFTANNGATAQYAQIGTIGGYSWTSQLYSVSGAAFAIAGANGAAHPLPGIPQFVKWVLVMTNTGSDNGYVAGDEVDLNPMMNNASGVPIFIAGANSSNVFLYKDPSKTPAIVRKSDGSVQPITSDNWRAKAYARWWPY